MTATVVDAPRAPTCGYLCGPDGVPHNAETFCLDAYLASIPMLPEALRSRAGRVAITRDDPLLYAAVYVPHLLKNPEGEITFGDVHLELYRHAMPLRSPGGVGGDRRGYAAPRGSGKSTCLWTVTNLWLAAHHPTFVAAFSDTGTQAADHLKTIKTEMLTNRLLREDYPDACRPMLKPNGLPVADSEAMYYSANGYCFAARGIGSGVLGLVDPMNRRPQVIMLDDIEGQEGAGYSLYQAENDLKTITEGILPMNDRAHVRLIGTVHLAGGILDQMVRSVTTKDKPARWITEERFTITYFEPIVTCDDGRERSCWPGRWSLDFLQSIRHTRAYAKSFLNQPGGVEGGYWTEGDITYGTLDTLTQRCIRIDPATTTKRSSDRTGIAIVAYSPSERRCVVEYAEGVHLTGRRLGEHLKRIIERWPRKIDRAIIEVNQGGDLWHEVLDMLPCPIETRTASLSKEVRFAQALDWYQRRPPLVMHAEEFIGLEAEMTGFPRAANDDIVDAVVGGLEEFLASGPRVRFI